MRSARTILTSCLIAGLAGACGALDDDGPPYDSVAAQQARLVFGAPALDGTPATHLRATRDKAGYRVERARWEAHRGAMAELMMIESLNAKGLDVPDDPQNELVNFTAMADYTVNFGDMYQSETGMGPSVWRRFVAGDRKCVIFSQKWDDGPQTPVTRTLFGYYCAPPGAAFTLQDAQSVLQTVSAR